MVSEECSLERTLICVRNVHKKEKKYIRSLVNICCGTVFRHPEKKGNEQRSVSKANFARNVAAAQNQNMVM